MARARNIKPGFFANEDLAECDPMARLLFISLWTLADRAGRLENRPKKIKVQTFPYCDCDIESLISQLVRKDFLLIYESGGKSIIQIKNWDKHQNPHHKEVESELPIFEKSMTCVTSNHEQVMDESSMNHGQTMEIASCPTDSLNLIPDSGFLIEDSESQQVAHAPQAAKIKKIACRLPDDWKPTVEYWDEALLINKDLTKEWFMQVAHKFKDYWIAKSGKDATKANWLATWRNWVRREVENGSSRSGAAGKKSYGEQRSELFDAVTDYNRATDF